MIFKIVHKLDKWQKQKTAQINKAKLFALKRTAYELMKDARQDLKTGQLHLEPLSQYRDRSDKRFKKRRRKRDPLAQLFRGITYFVDRRNFYAEVGFRGVGGTAWTKKLAEKHLEGYRWRYTDRMRAALHRSGIHLRKGTTFAHVPARDPISLIHEKYDLEIAQKVKSLFLRKMRGEYIE